MPTVVIEDGTIVAGANSWIDAAYVTAYAAARGLATWLPANPAPTLDAAVLEAADYLRNEERYLYRGTRAAWDQTMPWPRTGAAEYRGPAIPSNGISWRLKEAQAYLAVLAFGDPGNLQVALERGGAVQTEKVDVIETTYMATASNETHIRVVAGLLQPLLLTQTSLNAAPYQAAPDDPPAFQTGVYSNPPAPPITS